jgi:alanyl-tRNA synthetase
LVETLSEQMGDSFPEISQKALCSNVIREENSFLKTLDQGLILLDVILNNTGDTIDGKSFRIVRHIRFSNRFNCFDSF